MFLYYITDRKQFPGNEAQRRTRLLDKVSEAGASEIDYIQLREKDLSSRQLESLAREAVRLIRESGSKTRLLINSRTDIALAAQADGVHLRSNDVSPIDVRGIWQAAKSSTQPITAVSCHTQAEVIRARESGADFVVFGPIFEKQAGNESPTGLEQLQHICRNRIPVLALGGVTLEHAPRCKAAGASGIAAIRLFQENEIASVVERLRVG